MNRGSVNRRADVNGRCQGHDADRRQKDDIAVIYAAEKVLAHEQAVEDDPHGSQGAAEHLLVPERRRRVHDEEGPAGHEHAVDDAGAQ